METWKIVPDTWIATASLWGVDAWGRRVFMLQRDTELLLPVEPGLNFGVHVQNHTKALHAFPSRLLNADGEAINVYAECPITDPRFMPSTGGMWEARAGDIVRIDAFQLPEQRKQKFIADPEGLGYKGKNFDRIQVCGRGPVDAEAVLPDAPVSSTWLVDSLFGQSGFASRGVSIGAGAVEQTQRIVSNLDYVESAYEIAEVRIITRADALTLMADAGIDFPGNWLI